MLEAIIMVVIFKCGEPDTYIMKEPDKPAVYFYNEHVPYLSEETYQKIYKAINDKDTIKISVEDERGICV